jgi:hypothetical protein
MAERKFLYMDDAEGFSVESDPTTDTMALAGATFSGDLAMTGGSEVTGLPATPSSNSSAASKEYVDSIASGIKWKDPVETMQLVGNATVAVINGLTPVAGDSYIMTDAGTLTTGSLAVVAGDVVEYSGTAWIKLTSGVGGFVPDGTRIAISTGTALVSPYTNSQDEGKVMVFDGTDNTGTATGDAEDGNAILAQDDAHVGYWDNLGFVYEGTVPTGTWIQFTGAGTVNAGDGLDKSGNTIFVGNGDGIQVNANSLEVELTATTPGLELTGTSPDKTLQVAADGAHGIIRGASGMEIEIDDSPDTLDVDGDGLKVVGVPSLFKVNDTAVGATVTAANLDTLTDTSNADALHSHSITAVEEAKRIEDTHTNNVAVSTGDAVRWSGVNNEITPADNSAAASARSIGIARVGGGASPATSEIVKQGVCPGVIAGATVNTPYYLGAAGALVVFASIPKPGRVVRMGFAKNATDLDVAIMDYGHKRA